LTPLDLLLRLLHRHDGPVMRGTSYILGSAVMLTGVALVITAMLQVFRRHGAHGLELVILMVSGALLILCGRWVIQ
jgi:hypothetical protein